MSNSYPNGYTPSLIKIFSKRSVDKQAHFLLPFLNKEYALLDCGCGPGTITLGFASTLSLGRVVGVDINGSQIVQARELAVKRKLHNVEFFQGDIAHLEFKENSFDVVFTSGVLWSVSDIYVVLKELKRVVKPGGIIACREPFGDAFIYHPRVELITKALDLLFRSQSEFGCDNNMGEKLPGYFLQEHLYDIQATFSWDVFSLRQEVEEWVQVFVESWKYAPWANKVREKGWASEEEIEKYLESFYSWKEQLGAQLSMPWYEVIGYVEK